MSIQAVSYVLGERGRPGPNVRGAELLVLISIANHADFRGECWPSHECIANEARLTITHVRRCIRKLISTGEIERIERGAPDARIPADRRTNLYRLTNFLRGRGDSDTSTPIISTTGRKSIPIAQSIPTDNSTPRREYTSNPSSKSKSSAEDYVADRTVLDEEPSLQALLGILRAGKNIQNPGALIAKVRGNNKHVSKQEALSVMRSAQLIIDKELSNKRSLAEAAERRLAAADSRSRAEANRRLGIQQEKGQSCDCQIIKSHQLTREVP